MEQTNTSNGLNLSKSHDKHNGKGFRSWRAMVHVNTWLKGRKLEERKGSKEMAIKNEIIEQINTSNELNLSKKHG